MILATAAFRVKLYVPLAVPALRLKQKAVGPGYVKSYVKAKMLTHDAAQAARYDADPLIFRQIAVNILLDLHDTSKRLLADAGAINVPTLMLGAGSDWVVSLKAQREFFNGLSSAVKRMHVFPAAYHAIFHEKDRARVVDRVREFVLERFAQPASATSLLEADDVGYTWEEHERLKLRGGPQFPFIRAAMKTGGRLSKGIDLGWRAGFDSGLALDYIYENQPQGSTRLGRWIDKAYLDSIGWRGIRQRKVHLESSCERQLRKRRRRAGACASSTSLRAGGRYVLETLHSLNGSSGVRPAARLQTENVEAARALAERARPPERASCTKATPSIANPSRRSTARDHRHRLGTATNYFPTNTLVTESLAGLADAHRAGGPSDLHEPAVASAAWNSSRACLRNREGQPWIMRRRTTAEMDQLVQRAGFEKIEMEIDQWGMFSVSVARRAAL